MLWRMKSSTAGLIVASTLIQSTWAAPLSLLCARAGNAPAANARMINTALSAFTAQLLHDLFDIFPDQFFIHRIAEQISRVKCGHELDAFIRMPLPPQSRDRDFALEESLYGEFTQADNNLRLTQINLLFQV